MNIFHKLDKSTEIISISDLKKAKPCISGLRRLNKGLKQNHGKTYSRLPKGYVITAADCEFLSTPDYIFAILETSNTTLLEILAKDEDCYVREAVARNQNTPMASLKILAKDEDFRVRSALNNNKLINK